MAIAALRPSGPSRERLARTALRLFAEKGYDGVSNRQIVAACGLTKGAIYWYFESKEDLFRTVVAEALQSFQERLAGLLDPEQEWDATLRAVCQLFLSVVSSDDDVHRDLLILLVHRFPRGPGADRLIAHAHQRLVRWIEALVSRRDGPITDGATVAALIHSAGLGILVEAAAGRDVARATLTGLLDALGAGPLDEAPMDA